MHQILKKNSLDDVTHRGENLMTIKTYLGFYAEME